MRIFLPCKGGGTSDAGGGVSRYWEGDTPPSDLTACHLPLQGRNKRSLPQHPIDRLHRLGRRIADRLEQIDLDRSAHGAQRQVVDRVGKGIDQIVADLKRGKAAKSRKGPVADINWNGRLLAIGADAANTQALFDLFQNFPANCPPTLVVQQMSPGLLTPMIEQLREQIAPKVVEATDGMKVEQGTIYFAPQGETHMVVDSWPEGTLRLLAREPVAGERPSISLLFASVAKAAGSNSLGVLLALDDEDGSAGLRAMLAGGAYAIGRNGTDFTLNKGAVSQPVAGDAIFANIMKLCSK